MENKPPTDNGANVGVPGRGAVLAPSDLKGPATRIVVEAAVITVVSCLFAFGFNFLRPEHGIPLVARHPYEIFAPCPEELEEAESISPSEVARLSSVLFIDARAEEAHSEGKLKGATLLTYDELFPPSDEVLRQLREHRVARLVVYGEVVGQRNSGRMLARDLVTAGLRNVRYLEGDVADWVQSGLPVVGQLVIDGGAADKGDDDGSPVGMEPEEDSDGTDGDEGDNAPDDDQETAQSPEIEAGAEEVRP